MSEEIQSAIDDIKTAVGQIAASAANAIVDRVTTLLDEAATRIEEVADDPTALNELAQAIRDRSAELAGAVVADTSAAVTAPDAPTP